MEEDSDRKRNDINRKYRKYENKNKKKHKTIKKQL